MKTPRRVLFVLKHPGYVWQYGYANVIDRLVEQGCEVVVAFTNTKKQDWLHQTDLVQYLSPEKAAAISVMDAPVRENSTHLNALRSLNDYLRYGLPTFMGADVLKWRARSFTPARWIELDNDSSRQHGRSGRFWQWLSRSAAPDLGIARFLREVKPDVVVLSQLVEFVSNQRDYVEACESLGIPSVYMVASWDNLTNKGAVAVRPTKLLVWNEVQKQEAVALHGLPDADICVCGAVPFEDLRERTAAVDREVQLRALGLSPDDEYIVFLGSSNFISEFGEETAYFQSFAAAMAKHPEPRISRMIVVIRPHPQSAAAWAEVDLRKIGPNCVLSGNQPLEETGGHDPAANRQDFYNLMYYATASYGANTTAMIEASIIGTPVVSVETLRGQRETIHYYYLRTGVLASSQPRQVLDELLAVLEGEMPPRMREFPAKFAFPAGPERPSTLAAKAILDTVASRVRARTRDGLFPRMGRNLGVSILRTRLARDWQGVLDARLRVKYQASEQLGFQRLVRGSVPMVFGLTAHNNAEYLRGAVSSILDQTFQNFALVCVDDASSDETADILREFEKADPRVRVFRNRERLGMVGTWRKAFELATAVAPDAKFFAWASDHDLWDPQWLERMLLAASARDDAVLVYPQTAMIDGAGNVLKKPVRPIAFDTENTTTVADRVAYTARTLKGAGNMVYGLFRVDALRLAGVFRGVLLPDRLLMLDMATQGRLLQVNAILWKRRMVGQASLKRQLQTLFTEENSPSYLRVSWAVQHAVAFALQQFRALQPVSGLSVPEILRLTLLVFTTQREVERAKASTGKMSPAWSEAVADRLSKAAARLRDYGAVRMLKAAGQCIFGWGETLVSVCAVRRGTVRPGEVLFVGRRYMHAAYYRSIFDQTLEHRIPLRILFDREWCAKDPAVARDKFERFLAQNPRVWFGWAGRRATSPLRRLLFSARELRAYLSYDARRGVSEFYVERWWALLTPSMKARLESRWFKRVAKTWLFRKSLSLLEVLTPPDPEIVRELLRNRPSMVLVSPLIQRFSEEVEYLKAARFLGIRTAALVLSWDTLSTKGLIHVQPDHLLVWNEHHRRQAMRIHGVPASRIHVVGAPFLDRWFEKPAPVEPSAARAKWGIATDRYVLYLGSSANIARDESWFVEQLADALAARPEFADVSLVVRPHPANRTVFEKIDRPGVFVTNTDGSLPDSDREHQAFAALIRSAVCCIGVNTSAMIDAVLAGAPTATVLLDEYAGTQKKAEHFVLLAEAGCLEVFDDASAFVDWAADLRAGDDRYAAIHRRFAQAFARPGGWEVSAAEMSLRALGLINKDNEAYAAKSCDLAAQQVDRRRRRGMSETRFGSSLEAHLDHRLSSEVYQNYLWARAAVLRMMDDEEVKLPAVSDYWRTELEGFRYMLDASPLIVDHMREHCYHITGIKSYDYRDHHAHKATPYLRKLEQLQEVDPGNLFVPECHALGGFGYRTPGGDLINIDTLKFYEVMIGLHLSGFAEKVGLQDAADGRRHSKTIMEIGSGWGGFAYYFKTLYPGFTYVCLDLPQTMIFSLTYLKNIFPDARFLLVDSDETAGELENYQEYDFVLVPHQRLEDLRRVRFDACINMVSFQEMKSENVRAYTEFLRDNNCPYLYSLNRDRSAHNSDLTSVSEILGKYYDLRERDVLTLPYTNFGALPDVPKTKGIHDYRHQFGIRKVKV